MAKDTDRYYPTTSLQLAIFLFTKQQQVAGVNLVSSRVKEFVFVRSERLEELVGKYKFGNQDDNDLLVPVHLYEQARNTLLDRLNDR